MPIPLIPIAIGMFASGMLRRHGENRQLEAAERRKEQKSSTDAFIKILGELSQAGDVSGVQGLQKSVLALPQGETLYEGALAQAQSGQIKQQTMQGFIKALLGSQGQGDMPQATGGGTPGPMPLAGPPAPQPAPTLPQQDLSTVSRQVATINQTPTLQRTPEQVKQRGQLITEESNLTDKMLLPELDQAITATKPVVAPTPTQADRGFPTLPGIMKLPSVTTVTIPKDIFGVEIHGSKAEALSGVIGQARQRGFTSGEIHDHLKQQGIDPPENLSHQAFNEFAGKYLTGDEFLKNPRKALQEISQRFPTADLKALTTFGQQAFTAAYIGAKQRLRQTGQYVSDRSLAQAAFNEATTAVGSEFVPDNVMQDLDRSKANTTENMMAELLDKGLQGDKNALARYNVMLQLGAQKIGSEEAARQIAQIRTKQAAEFMAPETLKDIERKGGGSLPFGTTPNQAAGATVIPPEVQGARTQRSTETDKMQFATQRLLPVAAATQARALTLLDKATTSGFFTKGASLLGVPSQLGQEIKGYDEFRERFIGKLRPLGGDTTGVISDKDVPRMLKIFPEGKAFVRLAVDRREQLIKDFSELETMISDGLGESVHPFKDIITKLQGMKASEDKFGDVMKDFDKAMKGVGK